MKKVYFITLAVAIFVVSCSKKIEQEPEKIIEFTKAEREISVKSKSFGFNLFTKAIENSTENIGLSPLSATYALSMAANGAAGETRQEIIDVLDFKNFTISDINEYNSKLVKGLANTDKKTTIKSANSVWINKKDCHPLSSFVSDLENNYNAAVKEIDFAKDLAIVQNWNKENTEGMIQNFPDKIYPDSKLLMYNALYFKGSWVDKFSKEQTAVDDFHGAAGISKVPFMHDSREMSYCQGNSYSIGVFSFGNCSYRLRVILPNEEVGILQAWQDYMSDMENLRNEFDIWKVDVKMPKIKLDTRMNLDEILYSMGIRKAFVAGEADFSNMFAEDMELYMKVNQAAAFSMDEEGVEAAASTEVIMGETSAMPVTKTADFHVVRPFIYIIEEIHTSTIILIGTVRNI